MKTLPNILYEDGKLYFVEVPEKPSPQDYGYKDSMNWTGWYTDRTSSAKSKYYITAFKKYELAVSEAIKNKMEIVNPELIDKSISSHGEMCLFRGAYVGHSPAVKLYEHIKEGELFPWAGTWEYTYEKKISETWIMCLKSEYNGSEDFRKLVRLLLPKPEKSLPEQGHEEKNFEDVLGESLKAHGMTEDVPEHLKNTDFLFPPKHTTMGQGFHITKRGQPKNEEVVSSLKTPKDKYEVFYNGEWHDVTENTYLSFTNNNHYGRINGIKQHTRDQSKPEPVQTEEKRETVLEVIGNFLHSSGLVFDTNDADHVASDLIRYLQDAGLKVKPVLHDDQERKDFCIWYYAQSQPLDANRVFDYFTRKSL